MPLAYAQWAGKWSVAALRRLLVTYAQWTGMWHQLQLDSGVDCSTQHKLKRDSGEGIYYHKEPIIITYILIYCHISTYI